MADSVTSSAMETYLVGGAVRDRLLGFPVKDRDWVVVGTTPDAMLQAGYKTVGKDFPVFLHPESHEEYALARTERKTGPGYHGFLFNTDATVTLEDDLLRRDLTLNAIAEDANGKLIDPFNGQQDINDRILRHVSPAFAEDPVRVLRLAKFMSRFSHLGFTVDDSTVNLVRSMVDNGEVDNLVAERVWQEFNAALGYSTPRAFFRTLADTGALQRVLPEMNALLESTSTLEALDYAVSLSDDPVVRFAAMCAEFTAADAPALEQFCSRLRVPRPVTELALLCARYTGQCHQCQTLNAEQLQSLLKALDVSRRPDRFMDFLTAAKAHSMSTQAPGSASEYPQANHLLQCSDAMNSIDAAHIASSQPNKTTISTVIKQAQIDAIKHYLSNQGS